MTPKVVDRFYARLAEKNPNPKGELVYRSPYTLLVAVVLSAQATDVSVNKATKPLFEVADTPASMLRLGEEKLKQYIRTIGLYNAKARNVIALSRILCERYDGTVPADMDSLESLPGVGRKTASVVLNIAFGKPFIAVATHVFRVSNRTGLAPGKTPQAVQTLLEKITPDRWKTHAHHWLILHGRYICKARVPDCPGCVVNDLCAYDDKTLVVASPALHRSKRAP